MDNLKLASHLSLRKSLVTPSAPRKIALFKSYIKCHCLKSASINADIVKCKVPHKGEGCFIKLINSTAIIYDLIWYTGVLYNNTECAYFWWWQWSNYVECLLPWMYNINYRHGCLSIVKHCLKAVWKIAMMTQACLLSFTRSCL